MQLGQVAALVTVAEEDGTIGVYAGHNADPKATGKPDRFTKIGAYHPTNRSLLIGTVSEHSTLKMAKPGELPEGAEERGAIELMVHFDAEVQRAAERAARQTAKAAKPDTSDDGDNVEKAADDVDSPLSPEAQLVASIEDATTKKQLHEIAEANNIKLADPEAKMADLRAEIFAGLDAAKAQ